MTKSGRLFGAMVGICALLALFGAGSALAADTGEIHGVVTDPLGEPIEGISVCAEGTTPLVPAVCDYRTDAEGKYSLTGLMATAYRVSFHVESDPSLNFVPQWYDEKARPEEADPVTLAEGESREVDARMQVGGEIEGTVTDPQGHPIENVEACAARAGGSENGEVSYCGRTDANGEYTVKNLGSGEYTVYFGTEAAPNFVARSYPASVTVTAGSATEGIDAELATGLGFEGEVTDAVTGQPVHFGVPVCAYEVGTERTVGCAYVEYGGHYALTGLPPGDYVIGFSVNRKEDGVETSSDGYARRYWHEAASFAEATPIGSTTPALITGIDAVLTPGAEAFPASELTPAATVTGATTTVLPTTKKKAEPPRCKKGFRKVTKGGHARCVKIQKKPKRQSQSQKKHHSAKKVSH